MIFTSKKEGKLIILKKIKLNTGWEYIESEIINPVQNAFKGSGKKVNLPHDYGLTKDRKADNPTNRDEGFTSGATSLYYKKSFFVKSSSIDKSFILEFEGIMGIAHVWVNNNFITKHVNGYTSFYTDISKEILIGEENQILVYVENRHKPNSRWYTGIGIYRHVWLYIGEKVHIMPWMLHVETEKTEGDKAYISIRSTVSNMSSHVENATIQYEILDMNRETVYQYFEECELQYGSNLISHEAILSPFQYWNLESPYLYTIRVGVSTETQPIDYTEAVTGIRTIEFDSKKGFLLNGEQLKLKGGCIHHDHGILGAASHDDAEFRKVKLLKEAGFNAVRLAHNPYSPTFLDICDKLGMLVIEEAFDAWVIPKKTFDYNIFFEKLWEEDITSMINRDFNHPSIIMWSTGNEVDERDGSADGYNWSRRLAKKVKSLDSGRAVTASACSILAENESAYIGGNGNIALNMLDSKVNPDNDVWGDATEKYLEPLDTVGYNYKVGRYSYDAKRYPNRVIYGAETFPSTLFESWSETLKNPNVIGDFVWTAIDYLGEAGVGYVIREREPNSEGLPLTAFTGDIDIIGNKRPQSYYRDIVWGNRNSPYITVWPPSLYKEQLTYTMWAWHPVEHNYTFKGQEGMKTSVEIYSNGDEVELFVNGITQGRKPVGYKTKFKAEFEILYQPGKIEAVAYKDGKELGRDCLETARETTQLKLEADKKIIKANGQDLCYIKITALDSNGNEVFDEKGKLVIDLEGCGELIALGTGNPKPLQLYNSNENYLYEGKALAVVKSTLEVGKCTVKIRIDGCDMQSIVIECVEDQIDESEFVQVNLIKEDKNNYWEETLEALLDNEKTKPIIEKYCAELINNAMFSTVKSMPLNQIMQYAKDMIPDDAFDHID